MRQSEHYCPFLNRGEAMCGKHFGMSGVAYVLKHCFGKFQRCETHQALDAKEKADRALEGKEGVDAISGQCCHEGPAVPRPLVEVTITPGLLQRLRAR